MSVELAQHNRVAAPRRSLRPLWAIAAVSIAPLVLSFAAYQWWRPAATVNYGTLVVTQALPDPALRLVDGAAFRLSQLKGKWVLLMVDGGGCNENCARKLYTLRQLRLAQGQDRVRIERVWLLSDELAPRTDTMSAYEGTWFVHAAASGLLGKLPVETALADHIYVVDPLGNLVLRYGREANPTAIIKDIGRLLKASRIE